MKMVKNILIKLLLLFLSSQIFLFEIKPYENYYSSKPSGSVEEKLEKVNELIKQKWLCPIIPYVFEMDKKKDEVQILKYIFEDFKKENRRWGFSFHSKQTYAFSLFYYHFQEYFKKKTDIRPFILIGDDFYDILQKTDKELKMIKIKEKINGVEKLRNYELEEIEDIISVREYYNQILKQISDNRELKYGITDIKSFESSPNSMGYVVQRFSMGYDFKDIKQVKEEHIKQFDWIKKGYYYEYTKKLCLDSINTSN